MKPVSVLGHSMSPEALVVGKINHHSIELSWGSGEKEHRGPTESWTRFSVEQMDPKTHTYGTIYVGYSTQYVVEGLQPSTLYKFRLRSTKSNGQCCLCPALSVSTTREPLSGKHLHQAVNRNDEEALNKVLQSGLMLACFAGHLDIVKYLRECGATWQSQDMGGCSPLHWAADGGHLPVIDYMIQDGCELDVRDTVSHWTPLMRVSAMSGNAAVASLLIRARADVNVRDKNGKTPLMVAVLNNHEELVQLLLDNGADHLVKNEFGSGAAEMAKAFGRQNIIHLLEGRKFL
ncbi:fibronectin type 3 and ankyrin repeat domains protein 1-like isoform X4 [Hoplias malabaricus]|uniref:fibronectin type 3 and ankyrin repeat domains protein 1-like isoform X4 n=1 Tax=Hoplias malabaricus TaxID=27720 RepID=UPI003462FF95